VASAVAVQPPGGTPDQHLQEALLIEGAVSRINSITGDMMLKAHAIGRFVLEHVMEQGRGTYGARLVARLASHPRLAISRSTLYNYIAFARAYPELGSGSVPDRLKAFSASHLFILGRIDNPDDRAWFEHRAAKRGWSVRKLEQFCASHCYRRPIDETQAPPEDEPPRHAKHALVRIGAGAQRVSDLQEKLEAFGPASFRVAPAYGRTGRWYTVAVDHSIAQLRIEHLCLLRAFVELASVRRLAEVTIEVSEATGEMSVSADNITLRLTVAHHVDVPCLTRTIDEG